MQSLGQYGFVASMRRSRRNPGRGPLSLKWQANAFGTVKLAQRFTKVFA
jgi:hypothetical protein